MKNSLTSFLLGIGSASLWAMSSAIHVPDDKVNPLAVGALAFTMISIAIIIISNQEKE